MKCLRPFLAKTGRVGTDYHYMPVPCGKCLACRVNRAEELAGRIMVEYERAVASGKNCYFLTLTYAPEFLPSDDKFDRTHVRLFLKRYRNYDKDFRYFVCSEYGSEFERQHYHLCFFTDVGKGEIYEVINKCWPFGIAFWKRMHHRSPAYICKYVVKFDDRKHSDKPFVSMSQNFGNPSISECVDDIRRSADVGRPALFVDILGKSHPYPRRVIGKCFTPAEKLDRSLSPASDEFLESKRRLLRPDMDLEHFRVWYENYLSENQVKNYFRSKIYKK